MLKRIIATVGVAASLLLMAPAQASVVSPPPVAICVHGVGGHIGPYVNGTQVVPPIVASILIHFFPAFVAAGPCAQPDSQSAFIFCASNAIDPLHKRYVDVIFVGGPNGAYRIGDTGEFTPVTVGYDGLVSDVSLGRVAKGTVVYASLNNGETFSRVC